MRKAIAAIATAAIVLGGFTVALVVQSPDVASAQEVETEDTAALPATVEEILADLVEDNVITEEQSAQIAEDGSWLRPNSCHGSSLSGSLSIWSRPPSIRGQWQNSLVGVCWSPTSTPFPPPTANGARRCLGPSRNTSPEWRGGANPRVVSSCGFLSLPDSIRRRCSTKPSSRRSPTSPEVSFLSMGAPRTPFA